MHKSRSSVRLLNDTEIGMALAQGGTNDWRVLVFLRGQYREMLSFFFFKKKKKRRLSKDETFNLECCLNGRNLACIWTPRGRRLDYCFVYRSPSCPAKSTLSTAVPRTKTTQRGLARPLRKDDKYNSRIFLNGTILRRIAWTGARRICVYLEM